jgi:hypothetical protein
LETLLAIGGGAVCGLVAAAPLFFQLRHGSEDLGRGFGAVIAAFLVIQAAMFAVYALVPAALAPFGVTATLAFLAVTVAAVLLR